MRKLKRVGDPGDELKHSFCTGKGLKRGIDSAWT